MKPYSLFFLLMISTAILHAQDTAQIKQSTNKDYAVVYSDCGGFGDYCIYYNDGTDEDYLLTHHIKKPKDNDSMEPPKCS